MWSYGFWGVTKAALSKATLELVSVAQDIEPISVVPAERSHAQKRKAPKRKLGLSVGSDDEIVAKEQVVENVVLQQEATTSVDDIDNIILRVIAETNQMESGVMEPEVAEKIATGTDIEEPVEPRSEDIIVEIYEESTSIEDLLQQIPGDALLPFVLAAEPTTIKFSNDISIPGVSDGDLYKASLPKIALADKGKAPLVEEGIVKGHPAREMVQLIFGDIEFLIQLREQVIDEVSAFFNSFSLRRLPVLTSLTDIAVKEEKVLTWDETDSVQIALQRRLYIVAKYRELLLWKFLGSHRESSVLDNLALHHRHKDIPSPIDNLRQGVQTDTAALSIEMHEFKKAVRAQNAFLTTDLADLRKEAKDLKAELSKDFDDKLAVIRNDLLEFRVETQGQLASLSTNLVELKAFVTKGRDDKKGEVSSSHGRGQPPPGDGGGSVSRSEPSRKRGSSGSRQKSWRYWLNE
ncbi:receptor-like protein kinase [Dorcoceras hygrometricum]|uniref:Receptor-like protein kinase n=1 Tax=Dorcoceras hygrometricum TaxID=472368 RepID=A0A2Z7ASP2_9LAMI|nr:receptor-like protein kinase [Dorcoceras hygrometricum]